jgi:hypothetical protein
MSGLRRISSQCRVYTVFVPRENTHKMTKKTTKRTASGQPKNLTQDSQAGDKFDVSGTWRALEARVRSLELLVAKLDLEDSEESSYTQVGGRFLKKRGPKTLPDFVLADRRDELIAFFESNWPELEPLCAPSPNFGALRQAFLAFANPGQSRTPWGTTVAIVAPGIMGNHDGAVTRLLHPQTFLQLKVFLTEQQPRFAANPRQLANAMAGCPDLTFWTSLKRCQRIRFRFGIDERAMRAHIRRKHPKLYDALSQNPGLPELAAFWKAYRTKDGNMVGLKATDLERFWRIGNTH